MQLDMPTIAMHTRMGARKRPIRKRAGFNTGSIDVCRGGRFHDFNSSKGFLPWAQLLHTRLVARVALYAALMLKPGCLMHLGPDCRSWGTPARGTTKRTAVNVMGIGRELVYAGNRMVSRCLVMSVVLAGRLEGSVS